MSTKINYQNSHPNRILVSKIQNFIDQQVIPLHNPSHPLKSIDFPTRKIALGVDLQVSKLPKAKPEISRLRREYLFEHLTLFFAIDCKQVFWFFLFFAWRSNTDGVCFSFSLSFCDSFKFKNV